MKRNRLYTLLCCLALGIQGLQAQTVSALKINEILKAFLAERKVRLIDFKMEFGVDADGKVILADEITPDTSRLWDWDTNEKLDKDRFRRDMGGVEDAYAEVMKRLLNHDAT